MIRRAIPLALLGSLAAPPAHAEEGMWPFDMAPVRPPWIDKAMHGSVRFAKAASASFVSSSGLLLTNHHVGSDCIQQLSAQEGSADLMRDGFVAKTEAQERRCPDVEIQVLRDVEDVTARVVDAGRAPNARSEQEQNDARNAEIAKIEKACLRQSGLQCEVVTLYSGGAYHLYRYRKYSDVRLVFAPELAVAFFGGDRDNFTYPRFCLDVALFRAYENDAPAKTEDHFRLSKSGAEEGETIFISGHPKSTDRFAPVSKLELLEKVGYPFLLERLAFERDQLRAFSELGEAQAKAARDELMSVENTIKAITGYLSGLTDRSRMNEARKREVHLIGKVRALKSEKEREYLLAAWPKLETAYQKHGEIFREHFVLEKYLAPQGHLTELARHLLRHAEEMEKKNEVRLPEYRDSKLESLERSMFAAPPIDLALETQQLAIGLTNITAVLGPTSPLTKKLLGGDTPLARAKRAVDGTRLADVGLRRRLWQGGKKALEQAQDPMLELVGLYDARAREVREQYEDEVESMERGYYGRIAEAHRAAFGGNAYPDATFTLRLNEGKALGYSSEGQPVAWRTTFAGMFAKYDEAKGQAPYQLPERWLRARPNLDLDTPFDFVTTNDIIGGSSGSPMIGSDGKVVGLIFDGNLQQLPNRFVYREQEARAVGVHSRALLHALAKVYDADGLVQELTR